MVQQNQLSGDAEPRRGALSTPQALAVTLHVQEAEPRIQSTTQAAHSAAKQKLLTRSTPIPLPAPTPGAPESDALLHAKYRDLARQHLCSLPALFTKFTGLLSHIAWAPTWPHQWSARELPTHSRLCSGMAAGCGIDLAHCRSCAARHLALALKSGHKGHGFTCWAGVRNFWLPLIVRGYLVGLVFVQALAILAVRPGTAQISRIALRAARSSANAGRQSIRSTKLMNRTEFGEAARLLRLVVAHVETSSVADLRKSDLSRAQQALLELQTVATRLRTELNGLVPAFNKTAPVLERENHTDRLVRSALEHIHAHFAEPFTLRQYARQLRLNPAYLSAQFSRAVGTPFKTYLTELRVEKARALLSDPTKTVAEVGYAVGYASPNRFRLAFKQMTRLSPRQWRETLRMEPNNPS